MKKEKKETKDKKKRKFFQLYLSAEKLILKCEAKS